VSKPRTDGKGRSRQNCVGSGCEDFSVKTSLRNKVADLLMDRRNFRRKRPSADSTSHQYARTSWNIQASALMVQDAFSNTQPMTLRRDSAIPK